MYNDDGVCVESTDPDHFSSPWIRADRGPERSAVDADIKRIQKRAYNILK